MRNGIAPKASLISSAALCGLLVTTGAMRAEHQSDRAQAILDRYVEAVGGQLNIERVHSRITRASMSLGPGISGDLETVQQLPDRVVERGRASGWGWAGKFTRGFDGDVGWSEEPDHALHKIEGTLLQQLKLQYRLDRDARLDQLYPRREVLADTVIDARVQHVLKLWTTFGTQETWYVDATNGLVTRTEVIEERGSKDGAVKITTAFEDYREVDGVRLPFRKVVHEGKRKRTITVTSIVNNGPLGDTLAPVFPKVGPVAAGF